MLRAYINYPNSRMEAHKPNRSRLGKHNRIQQRLIRIDTSNFSQELNKFQRNQHPWQLQMSGDDSCLEIDFRDEDFEWAVLQFIQRLLGQHRKPFPKVKPSKSRGYWK